MILYESVVPISSEQNPDSFPFKDVTVVTGEF